MPATVKRLDTRDKALGSEPEPMGLQWRLSMYESLKASLESG